MDADMSLMRGVTNLAGEKPTKYFCNLETRNFLNKTIKKVELEENRTIHNQSEILQQIKIFYKSVYL